MNAEIVEMPKSWREKLEDLEVDNSYVVDKSSSVSMCIHRNFKNSDKQFKIRKNKISGELRVWRIK